MVNDRGTIKWTTMMLPEHAKALRKLREQQEYKKKPFLDDQLIEENEIKLQHAIHDNLTVEIKYFKNHDFHLIKEKVRGIDENGFLTIDDEERTRIRFRDVIDVGVE